MEPGFCSYRSTRSTRSTPPSPDARWLPLQGDQLATGCTRAGAPPSGRSGPRFQQREEAPWSGKCVRLAQNLQVCPCIPAWDTAIKTEVGQLRGQLGVFLTCVSIMLATKGLKRRWNIATFPCWNISNKFFKQGNTSDDPHVGTSRLPLTRRLS